MSLQLESIPAEIRAALDAALVPTDIDGMRVAEDFFGVADLLHANAQLCRAMSDPARPTADKEALVAGAFGPSVQAATLSVLKAAVGEHWSRPSDLALLAESLGVTATLASAMRAGALAEVEHQLFLVQDLLQENRELRIRLSDMGLGTQHERGDLATSLFDGHVNRWTLRLVRRAVGRSVHGRLLGNLRSFAVQAAEMENKLLVTVETATAMTDAQLARLRTLLTKRLGKDVTLAVSIEPTLVGGFRLHAGTEAVDASVHSRIVNLRRSLVG